MTKMKENPHEHKNISPYTMEGYLYVQEKRRCWCGGCGGEPGQGVGQDRGKGWFSRNRIPGKQGMGCSVSGVFSGISVGMGQPGRITASAS